MPTFFLILLAPHLFISIATAQPRRLLHQPFVPQDTISPTESPSPPDRPFFPTEPSSSSSSPPPLSPRTVASFPANISSLSIPHSDSSNSKSSSPKLVVLAVVAAISALLLTAVFILVYFRRRQRRRRSVGVKSHRPDNSPGLHSTVKQRTVPRVSSTNTSSEFLYLGTIINSRPIEDPSTNRKNAAGKAGLSPYKSGSPELRPLPPLTRQSCGQYPPYEDLGSSVNGEEEFYSPRASLGGRESSSPTGSGSRRAISAIEVENFEGKSTDSSSSCSSSVSGSPTRSHSVSISPPVSSSPKSRKLEFNATPELAPQQLSETQFHYSEKLHLPSRSPSLHSLSPDRIIAKSNGVSIRPLSPEPGFYKSSDAYSQSSSPDRGFSKYADVFSVSPSPERNLGKKFDETHRFSNLEAAYASPHASPPKRAFYKFSDACSNSSSPPRGMKRNSDESSRFSYPKSPDASSLCTSPEKAFHKFSDVSSHSSSPERGASYKCFDVSSHSSLPQKGVDKIPDLSPTPRLSVISDENSRSPERVGASPQRPVITTPPPPPPPPSIPLKATGGGSPRMPSLQPCQPGSRPPVLVTPARPFISHSTAEVSPMELSSTSKTVEKSEETPKPKLKPLHWDKVRASSDREMVWDHLRSSSFKLNEERIETLFVVNNSASTPKEAFKWPVQPSPNQENRILDPKKSQNIAILLRALNVTTEEVCEALVEGNVDALGTELLESLLKMAPNKEEERKLKEHKDDSPFKLGPAENFLKAVLDIPFAFKRIDSMLYIANFESEVEYLKRSFGTLEGACEELKSSRMFLKLLEAVLKTGNRMNVGTNRGDAQAFKLDTLLKLADVKGADGKTTLLHFVVQEIVRTEGARLSNQTPPPVVNEDAKCRRLGLQVVCGLSSELADVKKAAGMDSDVLSNEVSKLSRGIGKIGEVIRLNGTSGTEAGNLKFCESMGRFVKMAQEEIVKIQALESVALSLVKEVTEYFHGNSAKEEAHPFRIFMVVRDFLSVLDRVCKEVGMINERTQITSVHKFPVPVNPTLPVPPPAVLHGRNQSSSSDDESSSP